MSTEQLEHISVTYEWNYKNFILEKRKHIRQCSLQKAAILARPLCVNLQSADDLAGESSTRLYWIMFLWQVGKAYSRVDSRLAPSQWQTSLQSNAVSHWLGANLESALYLIFSLVIIQVYHRNCERMIHVLACSFVCANGSVPFGARTNGWKVMTKIDGWNIFPKRHPSLYTRGLSPQPGS